MCNEKLLFNRLRLWFIRSRRMRRLCFTEVKREAIDLMILLDRPHISFAEEDAIYAPLYELELKYNTLINPLIYTKSYWEQRPMDYFKYNVQNEGIRL